MLCMHACMHTPMHIQTHPWTPYSYLLRQPLNLCLFLDCLSVIYGQANLLHTQTRK